MTSYFNLKQTVIFVANSFRPGADFCCLQMQKAHNVKQLLFFSLQEKERDHFSQFVTESFSTYCKRKRRDKVCKRKRFSLEGIKFVVHVTVVNCLQFGLRIFIFQALAGSSLWDMMFFLVLLDTLPFILISSVVHRILD